MAQNLTQRGKHASVLVFVLICYLRVHYYIHYVIICATAVDAACMQLRAESFLWDGDDLLPKKDQHRWICHGMYLVSYQSNMYLLEMEKKSLSLAAHILENYLLCNCVNVIFKAFSLLKGIQF